MGSEKCSDHDKTWKKRPLLWLLGAIIIISGIACLIGWLVLRPTKPRFVIQDATIYNLSVTSSPDLFTCVFQITVDSRNPNARIGLYYDSLNAYATYRDQQITLYTSIPPTYQGHQESNIWSPLIYGINVPISPLNVYALNQDQASGTIPLVIKIMGHFRWKVGSIISRRIHLHVTCPAYIPYNTGIQDSIVAGTSIKYPIKERCQVIGW